MPKSIKIAVLLTCYNRKDKTLNCLKSLFASILDHKYEITVFLVDDASTDGTSELIKKKFPQVKIIRGNGNLFWNKGMHLAWDTAAKHDNYDYYLWLNDDVILYPSAINTVLNTAREYPQSIICGTLKSESKEIPTYGGRNRDLNIITPNDKVQICFVCNGNLVMIPNYVYTKVGNLDSVFPHAIGDFDYSLRAKKMKIQTIVCPGYLGICESNKSIPNWCNPKLDLITRIKALYSPLAKGHPKYYFIFDSRHFGLLSALKHYLSIHLRLILPRLWK